MTLGRTQPRPGLLSRLLGLFPGLRLNGQIVQWSRMPDLEDWTMPHRSVDMADWDRAYNMARNPLMPDRTRLMDVYDSLLIDSHLAAAIESRVLRVLRSRFKLVGPDGQAKPELLPLLEQRWFEDFLWYAMEADFRGHTLIELGELEAPGRLKFVERINPRNVLPHEGLVVKRPGDRTGYKFREGPLTPYLVEVGRPDDLGILSQVGPAALLKKYALGSWSDYMHKFGIPPRWVKTPSKDAKRLKQLEDIMQRMVSSSYGVFAGEEDIQVMTTPGTDAYQVFDAFIKRLNSEISKRILGQDATTDNKDATGTYGSLKVMQGVAEDRHQSDKASMAYVINRDLFPRLVQLGYPLSGIRFEWDTLRDLSATELVDAVTKLGAYFEVDPAHVEERTGIRILGIRRMPGEVSDSNPAGNGRQGGGQRRKGKPEEEGDDDDEGDGVTAQWPRAELSTCTRCGGHRSITAMSVPEIAADAMEQLMRDTHAGAAWSQPYFEAVATVLSEGLLRNWGGEMQDLAYDEPDHVARTMMETNLFRFGRAKTLAIATELNELARGSQGFADFKRRVDESGLAERYNRSWLRTEYVTAANTGMQSSRWYGMQRSRDVLPYGEYWTMKDSAVRQEHREMDGKKWPLDHPIWAIIYPPNGRGCRCTVLPTQAGPEGEDLDKQTAEMELLLVTSGELERMKKGGFNVNRAITGVVFEENKSYRKQLGNSTGAVSLNVEQSYGQAADRFTLDAIGRRTDLPEPSAAMANAEQALRAIGLGDKNSMHMMDLYGRPWRVDRGMVDEHLNNRTGRLQSLHLVPEVLKQPDEIWLKSKGGTTQQLQFIRYYQGKAVVVRADVDMSRSMMRLGTWYELDPLKEPTVRNGLLVKRMPG